MVRPCEKIERGAHSEKNVRCGHSGEKKKRTARPTRERCMQERHDIGWSYEDNTTNRAAYDGTRQGRRRRSYNDGAVYFALRSGWVKHTLTKGLYRRILHQSHHVWWICGRAFHMLEYPKRNRRNQTRRETHQEHENTQQTKVNEMQVGAIQLMVLLFVFREQHCQVCYCTHAPELISRPVNTFVDSVSREHTQ